MAILPVVYDGSPEHDYLQNLLPVVLGDELGGSPLLELAPMSSARGFEADEDPASVANQLGVDFLLRGRATESGETIQARFELLNTTGDVAWETELTASAAFIAR